MKLKRIVSAKKSAARFRLLLVALTIVWALLAYSIVAVERTGWPMQALHIAAYLLASIVLLTTFLLFHIVSDLQHSEATTRALLEAIPDAIFRLDAEGIFRDFIPAKEFGTFVPPEEFLGRPAANVLPSSLAEQTMQSLRQALASGQPQVFEYALADQDTEKYFEARLVKIGANDILGLVRNITERHQAEEAMRLNEARFRALIENSHDMVSVVASDGTIRYISPSCQKIMGFAPEELIGKPMFDLLHPDDLPLVMQSWGQILSNPSGVVLLGETRARHADGNWHYHEGAINNLTSDPAVQGIVFNSRDITERKRTEQERDRLIAELEARNTEMERFVYTVSHDLKSPLITIRGFLGFLEKDASQGNWERLRSDMERISDATKKMQTLLDDLLELSRIGRLKQPMQAIPFDVIVEQAVALAQGCIQARGVKIIIGEDLPVVYGEQSRLIEVVQNLVDNAVKFMGDQPNPIVEIGCLGLNEHQQWVLFVRDNGIGIAPEYFEKIFGLFNKLDARSEGTGVGLAIVKRVMDVYGGKVWVESDGEGQGSTFYFTLPLYIPPLETAPD